MTEFLPTQQTPQPPQDPAVAAQLKLAQITSRPEVLQVIQGSALWQQAAKNVKRIETEQDYQNALQLFTDAKAALKYAEEIRHGIVDVPTKFSKLVNDMFRPLKSTLKGVIDHFSGLTAAYHSLKEQEAKASAKETERVVEEKGPVEVVDDSGAGVVTIEAPEVVAPPTTTKTSSGQVQMREYTEVEITDKVALLKAIVSKSDRNSIYTVDLVEFNIPAIKKICETETKKRKHPGVKWERVKKAV